VPANTSQSLYLRPFMIATMPSLGVGRPASSYMFLVIASPSGSVFSGSLRAVNVWLAEDYTRAAPGGTGAAKTGGNYAAAFAGQQEALDQGCDQVVWLDAIEHRWVEEMGGMNLFFVYGSGENARLGNPAADRTLLPGVDQGLAADARSRPAPAGCRRSGSRSRCGARAARRVSSPRCSPAATAAVITPVGSVKAKSGGWQIGNGEPGPVTMRLREELLGIQFGRLPDPHGWIHKII